MILLVLFAFALFLVACTPSNPTSSLPVGDPVRGERLFSQTINTAPACSTCHLIDGDATLGPVLAGYSERAATYGVSAAEYTYTSIIRPGSYIVPGYANSMYAQYDIRLSEQQIADLIAYMLQF